MSRTIKKPYTKSKAFDKQCRNNGKCSWCRGARTYTNKKRLLATLFIITVILVSCGTRKTSQQQTTFKSDSLSIENKRVLKQEIILTDIYSIKPFNVLKPMIIDGKEYFNATIVFDKSIIKKNEVIQQNKSIEVKREKNDKIKDTQKTDYTILYLGLFFILLLFIFLWFKLKV